MICLYGCESFTLSNMLSYSGIRVGESLQTTPTADTASNSDSKKQYRWSNLEKKAKNTPRHTKPPRHLTSPNQNMHSYSPHTNDKEIFIIFLISTNITLHYIIYIVCIVCIVCIVYICCIVLIVCIIITVYIICVACGVCIVCIFCIVCIVCIVCTLCIFGFGWF